MADHDLIDAYLARLAARLSWRPDCDDLVAEAADHLHCAADRARDLGSHAADAEQLALDRFGDPELVARAHVTTTRGGVAVPTESTRTAGTIALLAAALWLAFPASWLVADRIDDAQGWDGAAESVFVIGTILLLGAAGLTCTVFDALRRRHGGLGRVSTVALVIASVGTVMALLSWFIFGWMLAFAVASLLLAGAMRTVDIAPRSATAVFGSAWAVGLLIWVVLRAAEFGTPDEWGDYPAANRTALLVGSVLYALGLAGLGRWLRAEQPVDAPSTAVTTS